MKRIGKKRERWHPVWFFCFAFGFASQPDTDCNEAHSALLVVLRRHPERQRRIALRLAPCPEVHIQERPFVAALLWMWPQW